MELERALFSYCLRYDSIFFYHAHVYKYYVTRIYFHVEIISKTFTIFRYDFIYYVNIITVTNEICILFFVRIPHECYENNNPSPGAVILARTYGGSARAIH